MIPRRMILVSCVMLIVAGACSNRSDSERRLVVGIGGSLNLGFNNPVLIQRNANVWESLTRLDSAGRPQPQLAESWAADPTATKWTLRLRRDVVFHNGDSLTADLAVANILRYHTHPEFDYYGTYTHLDSVYAAGPLEVSLVFSRPCVDFPNRIGHYFSGIFSPKSFGPDGKLTKPVGCGPYRFVRSVTGQYDLVEAFDRYHGGKPYFNTVEFRIIPDPLVRVMALLRGDIDIVAHHGGVLAEHRGLVSGKADVVIDSCDIGVTHYLFFNCAGGVFRESRARAAFSAMLDRTEIAGRILRGKGVPAHDYFMEGMPEWDRNRFSVHPDSANMSGFARLLGHEPLTLALSQGDASNWGYRQIGEYLADYFGRRGVTVKIVTLEGGAWQRAVANGEFSFALYPLSIPTGTPELFVRALAYSKGLRAGNTGNRTHYSSALVDSLVERAIVASTIRDRDELYNRILDILARECPAIPIYHERYYFAYRKGLRNVRTDPFLKLDLSVVTR